MNSTHFNKWFYPYGKKIETKNASIKQKSAHPGPAYPDFNPVLLLRMFLDETADD